MSRVAIALMLLAGTLGLLILLELIAPGEPDGDAGIAPTAASVATALGHETGDTAAKMVADILARPLFRGDRRPAPADDRGNGAGQPADMPRLAGILMSSESRRAIFQPPGKERPIVVVEGETVGSWRVQAIAADAVTLTGPGGTRRLEPKFSSAAAPAVPQQLPSGAVMGGPLFGANTQQNGGVDRPQGKH